uniref:6-cysteine protein n=1 Tax=Strongyloides papillosus TaxID=174720 RepID=A0A0N5BU08_STREA
MELPLWNIILIFLQLHQFFVSLYGNNDGYKCLENLGNLSRIEVGIGIYKNGSHPITNNRYYPHVENDSYKDYKYNGKTLEEVLNAKKVYIIEIDISKFDYGDFEDDKKIILMFCPTKYYQTINSSLISEYEKRSLFLRYDKPRTCSLKICEIGIYYRPYTYNTLDKILNSNEKDVFYVVINNKVREQDIKFGTYVYDNHRYPLIPCPYTNWIPNINLTKFIPSKYVMENGIQFPDEYNDRHVFVPVIPSSNDNITLYCGKIYQPNFKEINVGVKLKFGSQSTSYDKIETTRTGVKCLNEEINPINHYSFSYTPDNINYDGNSREIKKFNPEKDNIYSGQIIIVYEKATVRLTISDYTSNGELTDKFFDKQKKVEPMCNGIVSDKEATLHLKINGKIFNYNKTASGIKLVKISTELYENKILHVGCHAVVDDNSGKIYEDFYLKRYKFVLFKGKLSNFSSSNKLDKINISSTMNQKNIYGYYSCRMDKNKNSSKIKESEFVLLPEKQVIWTEPVTSISKTNNLFFCFNNYMEIGVLSVIRIELPTGSELNNLDNPSAFTANESLIIFDDYNDYGNGVMKLFCEYKAFNEPFILLKRKFKPEDVVLAESTTNGNLTRRSNSTINGNSNGTPNSTINGNSNVTPNGTINRKSNSTSNGGLSTALIVTIIAVSLIVITVIIAVAIIICLKLKNKKKKKGNDSFSSIDISNSNSESSLSSASKTTSQSVSNFLKTKNSRSKFKVPIVLGSLSDPSMSMSTSKSNALSKTPMSKVVSNERRASKTK